MIESDSYWAAEATEVIRDQTVGDLLREAAEQAPDTTALVEGHPDPEHRRRWTYAELLAESEQVARGLLGRFRPGERVAVWANNLPEWVLLEMGAALAGLTLVTVNPALRAGELRHVLGQSRAAGIFLRSEYRGNPLAETLAGLRPDLPELREAVLLEEWADFRASGSPTELLPQVQPGDPAQIQYTSGTTGVPKGAVLHHRGITNSARLSYVPVLGLAPGDVQVNPMPLFHAAGCALATLSAVASLGTQVLMPHFDPGLLLELIAAERAAAFVGVPTMLHGVLDHPDLARTDLSALRVAASGGAVVVPELVRRVETDLGVPLCIIYAQTEASPAISMTRHDDDPRDRTETVGRPLPAVEVRIADPRDPRQTVSTGRVGEICTRGYHVMTGYYDQPEATRATIDSEGWLHTGDLGAMDARGYLRVAGRIKEMIIRGGENIYPREVEQVLLTHPGVKDAAVVGVPDPYWGEQVAAVVRPEPRSGPTEGALAAYVRERLAPHKVPRVWSFVDEFPLTGSGKVQKYVLRERLATATRPAAPRSAGGRRGTPRRTGAE